MGQVGFITFFVTHELPDPSSTLVRLLKLTEAPTAWYVSRDDNPTSEWDELQRFINDGQEYPESESHSVASNIPVENAAIHMRDGALIRCGFAGTPLGARLEATLGQALAVELHQGFLPADPHVAVGPHDIFECAEHDEGLLYGRATASFSLMGWSTPANWNEYRRRVMLVPEVLEIKAQVEEVLGPVESCVYWNI